MTRLLKLFQDSNLSGLSTVDPGNGLPWLNPMGMINVGPYQPLDLSSKVSKSGDTMSGRLASALASADDNFLISSPGSRMWWLTSESDRLSIGDRTNSARKLDLYNGGGIVVYGGSVTIAGAESTAGEVRCGAAYGRKGLYSDTDLFVQAEQGIAFFCGPSGNAMNIAATGATVQLGSGGASVTPLKVSNFGTGVNTAARIQYALGGSNYGWVESVAADGSFANQNTLKLSASGTNANLVLTADNRVVLNVPNSLYSAASIRPSSYLGGINYHFSGNETYFGPGASPYIGAPSPYSGVTMNGYLLINTYGGLGVWHQQVNKYVFATESYPKPMAFVDGDFIVTGNLSPYTLTVGKIDSNIDRIGMQWSVNGYGANLFVASNGTMCLDTPNNNLFVRGPNGFPNIAWFSSTATTLYSQTNIESSAANPFVVKASLGNSAVYFNNTAVSGNMYFGFQASGVTKWLQGWQRADDAMVWYNANASSIVASLSQAGDFTLGGSSRWTIPATGKRNSELGNGAGTWQIGIREEYNAAGVRLGTYGVTPVARQSITAAGVTAAQILTALHNLGLVLAV